MTRWCAGTRAADSQLHRVGLPRKLALFRTIGPTGGTGSLAGPCPLLSVRKLALFCRGLLLCPICHNSFSTKYLSLVSLWRQLALFGAFVPSGGRACGPGRQCLFRPARGKLGLFGAIGPSAGPRPLRLVSANWLCLYNRSQRRLRRRPRRPRPLLSSGELASFDTLRPSRAGMGDLAGPRHLCPPAGNWLCFAHTCPRGLPARCCGYG